MSIHKNYAHFEENNKAMREHVDSMFNLIAVYAKKHDIKAFGDDRAEQLVEAIATYVVECND